MTMTRSRKSITALALIPLFALSGVSTLLASDSRTSATELRRTIASAAQPVKALSSQFAEMRQSKIPKIAARGRRLLLLLEAVYSVTSSEKRAKLLTVRALRLQSRLGTAVPEGERSRKLSTDSSSYSAARTLRPRSDSPSGPFVPTSDCYLEESEPCMTETEMDDEELYLDEVIAEIDDAQWDLDSDISVYEDYCSQNPWNCEEGSGPESPDGASIVGCRQTCWASANEATHNLAVTALAALAAKGKLMDARLAAPLSLATTAACDIAIMAAFGMGSYWLGWFTGCLLGIHSGPDAVNPFEPGFGYSPLWD